MVGLCGGWSCLFVVSLCELPVCGGLSRARARASG